MATGLPAGTKLGRYEVIKHLAHGGMADLSVARATGIENFERHVVIKHLRPEQSGDASFVQMFVKEARLAGALHHHNIVQVHDIGQSEGRHFFAMEYVHGEDLRRILGKLCDGKAHLPLQHVVSIATAVCSALHHAHEQKGPDRKPLGIVHRDVTPGNILVSYDGNVKVVDFGIAKAVHRPSDTGVGMLKGKAPYMSPEQCTGKAVDRRSDVFSFGIVLYELVTVRRLFKGQNEFFTMSSVVQGEIPKPSTQREDLPVELEEIILKALQRDPAARYQTADEMRLALDQFADKAGLRTSPTALSDFMKKLFGVRPEPWMVDISPTVDAPVDFDKTDVGVVELPIDATPPKSRSGSLIEQARLQTTPRRSSMPIPSITGKTPPPVLLKRVANAETEAVQVVEPVQVELVRASTDIDELTEFDEPELELAPPSRGDVTSLVTPLPLDPGDLTHMTHKPVASRRFLYLAVAAVTALGIAIVIMLTGRSVEGPTAPPEPSAIVRPPEPKLEPKVETKPVEPVVEPKPVEPVVETKPVELKPKTIVRRPVRKPTPKPAPKPKNPQWDPDALFLKPKK